MSRLFNTQDISFIFGDTYSEHAEDGGINVVDYSPLAMLLDIS